MPSENKTKTAHVIYNWKIENVDEFKSSKYLHLSGRKYVYLTLLSAYLWTACESRG